MFKGKCRKGNKKIKSELFNILFICRWRRISDIIIFDDLISELKHRTDLRFDLDGHKLG